MRTLPAIWLLLAALMLPFGAAAGQREDDRGYLQRLLENSLSDAGRDVRIIGFEGALSTKARARRITIADGSGIWLQLDDVALQWNRSALLSGRLEITELGAKRIVLSRWPQASAGGPRPEARAFTLPQLPIAVRIGQIMAGRIELGTPILGKPLSLRLSGSAMLEEGTGRIDLDLRRLDGPEGHFTLGAGYSNRSGIADLDLSLAEAPGGIIASLAGMPGQGALSLRLTGSGPLDAFRARLELATENASRLAGDIILQRPDADAQAPLEFSAQLAGDIAPMFKSEYRDFFGSGIRLDMTGRRFSDGRVSLQRLALATASMQADMQLDLSAEGWPQRALGSMRISGRAGAVTLPLPGPEASLNSARLDFSYDAARGDRWEGRLSAEGYTRGGVGFDRLALSGSGRISAPAARHIGRLDGALSFEVSGLAPATSALADALGRKLRGRLGFEWAPGAPLNLPELRILGPDFGLSGRARILALTGQIGTRIEGSAALRAGDLTRFSALAGQKLEGRARLGIEGFADLPSGAFSLKARGETEDLRLGQSQLDAMLSGTGKLEIDALRDESGISLHGLKLTTPALQASAQGKIATGASDLRLRAALEDGRALFEGLPGRLGLEGELLEQGAPATYRLNALLASATGGKARLEGTLKRDLSAAALSITGKAPLALANPFLAPRQAEGKASFDLRLDGPLAVRSLSGRISTQEARLVDPQLQLALERISASASLTAGRAKIELEGDLSSAGHLQLSGPIDLAAGDLPADLKLRLQGVRLRRADLYDAQLDGALALTGPLSGGARIGGEIRLKAAELRLPDTAMGALEGVSGVIHLNEPPESRASRARAGLLGKPSGGAGPAYGLDIGIHAPARIFVRGRGLDAELGGALRLTGRTDNIVPQGGLKLIRGRLDILGKRLTLTEGSATLRGNFDPFVNLLARTRAGETAVSIRVMGPASSPRVHISSEPELPQEEVLARLIFGRGLDRLSPLQALRLASAIATLAGKGGTPMIDRLRQSFGLDDLDITTGQDGTAGARLGRYLGENIYSEITIGTDGTSQIDLNLNITPALTARGKLSNSGETSLGLFFEKDY